MRLSLTIDGDSKGGTQAAENVTRAIEDLGKAAADVASKVEEALGKVNKPPANPNPANDNAKAIGGITLDLVDKMVGKLTSGNEQLAKLGGGVSGLVRTAATAAGPAALIAGGFQLAEIAASALYRAINSGEDGAKKRLEDHEKLVGKLRDTYRDAANKVGDFYNETRNVLLLQTQQNLLGLRNDLQAGVSTLTAPLNTPLVGRSQPAFDGALSGEWMTQSARDVEPFIGALDRLRRSAAEGTPDLRAFRDEVAAIGVASAISDPAVAAKANEMLAKSEQFAEQAKKIAALDAFSRSLTGSKPEKGDRRAQGFGDDKAASTQSNEFDRMVKSLGRQTAAMEAEAAAVGKSAGEAARLRAEYLLLEAAQQAGIKVTDQHKQKIAELADQFGRVTQRAAELRLKSDIGFERGQIGRDDIEATVADKLRGVYGDDFAAQMDGSTAASIRLNEQLKIAKSSATEFASSFSRDLASGTGILDALNNALGRLQARLLDMIINQVVSKAFGGLIGGGAGGGGLLSALFGGGSGAGTTGALTMTAHTGAWAEGGYTGDMDRRAIAGVVHGKEFVINAWATAKHRPLLEAINDNAYPGYAAGGYVGPPPSPRSSAGSSSGGGGSNVVEFHLHEAPGVTTREERSQTADGRERVDIYQTMEDVAVRAIGSGAADKPMRGRMGVSPMPVKR